jgi:hypothetical protein
MYTNVIESSEIIREKLKEMNGDIFRIFLSEFGNNIILFIDRLVTNREFEVCALLQIEVLWEILNGPEKMLNSFPEFRALVKRVPFLKAANRSHNQLLKVVISENGATKRKDLDLASRGKRDIIPSFERTSGTVK